jgi:hypothetical protein
MHKLPGCRETEIAKSVTPAIGYYLRRRDSNIRRLLLLEIPWESYLELRFPRQTDPSIERGEELIAVHIEKNLGGRLTP